MTTLTYSADSDPGELVDGRWRVVGEIARGGMGVVYEGVDVVTGENVALKILKAGAESNAVERFAEEVRAAVMIDSPHIVRTLGAGCTTTQQPFLAMELLKGEDLGEYVGRVGPLPLDEVAMYAIQACEALGRAHAAGIIHRDIKPSNLFRHVDANGRVVVKIVDFGISKSLSREHTLTSSHEGAILGSPAYMSPEQIRDPRSVDHRSDLWSLGIVIYRLLTGETPWAAKRIDEVFACVLASSGLPSLEARGLPRAIDELLARCVAPKREDRFPDAASLARALAVFTATTETLVIPTRAGSDPTLAIPTIARDSIPSSPNVTSTMVLTPPPPPGPSRAARGFRNWALITAASVVVGVSLSFAVHRPSVANAEPAVAQPVVAQPAVPVETPIAPPQPAPTLAAIVPSFPTMALASPVAAPTASTPRATAPRRNHVVAPRRPTPATSAPRRELQPNPYAGEN